MITLDQATVVSRAGVTILDHIDLTLRRGEWTAVVGPNGAGKSTLLSVLAGLRTPDAGTVSYDDGGPPRVGMLLQEPDNQLVTSSVYHELELSLPPGHDRDDAHARITRASRRLDLDALWRRNPHELSGGEKQRLALATVWLHEPGVVLLDEPTAFLDEGSARRCAEFIAEMHAGGAAVVWVGPGEASDASDANLERADTVVCLERGRVGFHGAVDAYRRWPGRAAFEFPATPERDGRGGVGSAVVELEGVSFAYDDREVLSGIDLAIGEGECLGVSGRNGTGKSTLLLLAAGVLDPRAGRLTRRFERITSRGNQHVFYLPQSPERMFFAETVLEELAFGLRRLGLSAVDARQRAATALADVGLDPERVLRQQPFDLSYGEMRRVAFAVAGALEPALLLLDEPTACLDPRGVALFYDLIDAHRAAGTTVVVASHDHRALDACDRVFALDAV